MTGFERIRADLDRRRAEQAAAIAAADGARLVVLRQEVMRGELRAVVHRNTHADAQPWRATWLDQRGKPTGHVEAPSFAAAMEEAFRSGYQVTEVRR